MIEIDTVIVLGAGASCPYGYPTGEKLREYIYSEFPGNFSNIYSKTNFKGQIAVWETQTKQFSKIFKDSSIGSIDLFLARNQRFKEIGKIAIILSILDYEQKSNFREDSKYPKQDWYSYIYKRMTDSLINPDSYKDFTKNNVAFITFNYDRSLEHFLFESLRNSFSEAQENEIIEVTKKVPFYHVYGKVVDLPWENMHKGIKYRSQDDDSPYNSFSLEMIQELSSNILIVHEREKHDLTYLSKIRSKIVNAKRIYFLGFGYASENFDILNINRSLTEANKIFGTALGLEDKEIEDVRGTLRTGFGNRNSLVDNPIIENTDCVTLLKKYL